MHFGVDFYLNHWHLMEWDMVKRNNTDSALA